MPTDRKTQNAEERIRALAHRLRRDVEEVVERRAQALLEKSADVLGGLIEAFGEYRSRREREREREARPAPRRHKSARRKQPGSTRRRQS
jgi:hypothetical protein